MRLVDLHPRFLGAGGPGITNSKTGEEVPRREGVGVMFDCPCGCDSPCYVPFANPLDGGPALESGHPVWQRVGETFEDLTLTPSILRMRTCDWHGYVTKGEIITL